MRRGFWFVAGAASGVYALARVRRAAEALTPEGLRDRWAALSVGAHLFGDELRTEMAVRENDLRSRLAPELDGRPELTAGTTGEHTTELTREGTS